MDNNKKFLALWKNADPGIPEVTDARKRLAGRSEWKRQSGYYLQSHAENAFCRYKKIIGGRLRAKNDDAQKREGAIG